MNHPALPEPERQLGKYHIVRPLKVGGTAAIYLAVLRGENNFSREVVIKRPLPHLVADGRARLMFIDEAHIASRLSHPNICQVLDLVSREDELYLVLEYLKGLDLREILKRCMELGRLLPAEVGVWIAIEVAAGLDYAHTAQAIDGTPLHLIHRDVSPKNIRITDAGSVKVIDFGIARAMNRATETAAGTIKGTLGYMSPEQIMGDEIDHRSDIFAYGIVLFQMLTCRNPFDGPTLKERVRRLTQAPVPSVREFNGALDPEIEGIVARCLERDLDHRYQRMRDVQVDLDRYLAKLQVVSPRQRLIDFMEAIFPSLHETDPELKVALTEISSVTGKIDATQRLSFPDDPASSTPSATSASGASRPPSVVTRSTIQASDTASTVKDPDLADKTAQRPSPMNGADEAARYSRTLQRPRVDQVGGPKESSSLASSPARLWMVGATLVLAMAAAAVFVVWAFDRMQRPISEPIEHTPIKTLEPTAHAESSPKLVRATSTVAVANAASTEAHQDRPRSPVSDASKEPPSRDHKEVAASDRKIDVKSHEPATGRGDSPNRARMYFKTGVRLESEGRSEDALLMYTLAFSEGGKQPNVSILRNLGLLHNKAGDATKARACLNAYLDRSPGAPDADRIRTVISSFAATKAVPCVDSGDLSRAKKQVARRGAMIDSWVQETVDEGLRQR
jgi:serine/threonine-protein kinase